MLTPLSYASVAANIHAHIIIIIVVYSGDIEEGASNVLFPQVRLFVKCMQCSAIGFPSGLRSRWSVYY